MRQFLVAIAKGRVWGSFCLCTKAVKPYAQRFKATAKINIGGSQCQIQQIR